MAAETRAPRGPATLPPRPPRLRRWWQRASVLAWAALVVVAVAAAVFIWPGRSQANLRRIPGQNVLLVTIDTLRADALGSYGGPAATPALDRLAAEGVRFEFAHAHAVMTLGSHASILTGLYPFQHGVRDNSGYRLPADARTTATLLKQAGYATAAFVAAYPVHARFGLNAGFDVYDDRVGASQGPSDFTMPERPASAVVPLARAWIGDRARARAGGAASQASRPWFAWVHVFDPHAPFLPPAPFDAQYASRPYYGEVAAVDAALAALLDDLRAVPQPTLVIVTADHGEGLGDHGEEAHGIFAYESTLRVPLIMAVLGGRTGPSRPGRAGEVSPVSARHVDILPTILDATDQAVPADLPGRTLLPRDERRAGSAPRPAYFEAMSGMLNHGWAPLSGVLVDRDKLIDLPVPERYDLSADPGEQANLFGRIPERDRRLAAALSGFAPTLPGERVAEDAEAAAQLRALGYVSGSAALKSTYSEADDPKRLVDIDAAIHRALEAVGAGRLDEAVRTYQQLIDRRPEMAIPARHLAHLFAQQGDLDRAVMVLRQAAARGVTDARLIAQLGEYLTDAGQLAEGIRLLEPLTTHAAAGPDALNALGIAYARTGRRDDARRAFERLVALLPGSSAPLENLGVLALESGDASAAGRHFEKAIALDPANLKALFGLGISLARDGRMVEARPYLTQFLQAAPADGFADQRREVSRLLALPLR